MDYSGSQRGVGWRVGGGYVEPWTKAAILSRKGNSKTNWEDCRPRRGHQQVVLTPIPFHEVKANVTSTQSVDRKTDKFMQETIREEFKNHTIIAAAHRLDTILDFDRIAVLDNGELVEFDSPAKLLKGPSRFEELYESYKLKRTEDCTDDGDANSGDA
jgi:hypothetical protein